jgi:hypothetical protein
MVVILEIGGPIKTEAMYGRTARTPLGTGLWTAHVLCAVRDEIVPPPVGANGSPSVSTWITDV